MSEALVKQLERVRAAGARQDETLNPFWRDQLGLYGYAELLASGKELDPQEVASSLGVGYSAERLPAGVRNKETPEFLRWPAIADPPETMDPESRKEIAATTFLARRGLLDAHLSEMDDLGIVSRSWIKRQWLCARRLKALLEGPSDFLEIGPGGGQIGLMLAAAGLVRSYVFVDLPDMLLATIRTITSHLPDAQVSVGEICDGFSFLGPDEIGLVADASIGVALNFNSFSEMDGQVRDNYIAEVYRTAAPNALFYNVNRRHIRMTGRDGKPFENHPLLYPYRPDDQVIEWEPDEFQQASRSGLFSTSQSSFCISRIARINPSPSKA